MVRKENNIILVSPRLFLLKDKQVAQTDSAQTKGKLKNRSVLCFHPQGLRSHAVSSAVQTRSAATPQPKQQALHHGAALSQRSW
jgi:hypothetical protein